MSSQDFAVLERAQDHQRADTSVLSENKVCDLVHIAEGNIIGNQQQMVLGHLALATGFLYSHDRNVNTILTGPSAGGKSQTQEVMLLALPSDVAYQASDASSMGVLDDDQWEQSLMAPLDEWQKIPDKLTEILKGVAGGPDDQYRYVRSISDDEAESGRSGHEIIKEAKPFQFLYAQHSLDHELSTRLVFLPIEDNVYIRDAIIEKEGGAENIDVEGYERDFIYDTADRARAMRQHLRELPTEMVDENRRGMVDGLLPPWVRKSVKPILDKSRTETNRVAGQIFNLIRSSAVVNYDNRRSVTRAVDGHEIDTYIATPQDVANVLSARELLLAKTHHLTRIKREIIDAIRAHQHFDAGDSEGVGVTVATIQQYLQDSSSVSVPRKGKLRDLLTELDEHFYIDIHERAGPNGSHLYEYKSLRDIGVPRVSGLDTHMSADEVARCDELCPDLDVNSPFVDTGARDPFLDMPFVESVDQMREAFAENPVERASRTAELVSESGDDSTAEEAGSAGTNPGGSESNDGTLTLTAAMGDGDDSDVTLDGPVEHAVYKRLLEHADDTIWTVSDVEDLHLLGILDDDESASTADLSDTIVSPDHPLWEQPHKPDDWVTDQQACEREIEQALTAIERTGALRYDTDGQPDGFVATHVREIDN